jgi:hypothetical protein
VNLGYQKIRILCEILKDLKFPVELGYQDGTSSRDLLEARIHEVVANMVHSVDSTIPWSRDVVFGSPGAVFDQQNEGGVHICRAKESKLDRLAIKTYGDIVHLKISHKDSVPLLGAQAEVYGLARFCGILLRGLLKDPDRQQKKKESYHPVNYS